MKIFLLFLFLVFWETDAQSSRAPCMNPDNKSGQCISVDDCPSVKALFQQRPISEKNRNFLNKSFCGYKNGKSLVCCITTNQLLGPPITEQRTSDQLPTPGTCGFSLQDKIFGGKKAKITDYPWMALLQYTKPGGVKGFHCGGSLINDQYVLTAAHCQKLIPSDWKLTGVRLGEWNLKTDVDCDDSDFGVPVCAPAPKDIEVSEIILHEDYDKFTKTQYHDIALLRLKEKVVYTRYIFPICLPVHASLKNKDYTGESMEVAGWGKTETSSTSDFKLKLNITGVSLEDCNEVYKYNNIKLANWQVCAGGNAGEDSCNGDSGGPLMAIDDLTDPDLPYFYMAGLVSFGPARCGQKDWPGVYTNISPYIGWIESKLKA